MDCSPPSSSVHGILQARIMEWLAHSLLQGIVPTQGSNLGLLHCRQALYHLSHQGRDKDGGNNNLHIETVAPNQVEVCEDTVTFSLYK